MASAARGESSNPYGGGLGNGGKFRKPTVRKTPYERPSTSVRNSGLGNGGQERGGGWLSRIIVDPAQRLITNSAHRLFASAFMKRLGSGASPVQSPVQPRQQQLPERDVNQESEVERKEDTSSLPLKNDLVRKEDSVAIVDPTEDGFTDLEKILKEKTFTRSEVDRLTTLLRSKASDSSTANREQRNEVRTVRQPPSHESNRLLPDNGSMNALVSTPLGSSRALDECIASPAQLAKAYMGSRSSEVTPSMLELRGQSVREDSVFMNRTPFQSKSPTMSLVPKPSGQRLLENGFVTPRHRGRSAVYSMARTPYSRPHSSVKIGSLFQASPSTWEEGLSSGSRQGPQSGLKRRSSVLDNDIGSVGPVRRIRQKSNLWSRSLALPAAESPLSVRASSGQKNIQTSKDNAEDIPGSSFNLVPSQSSERASKILQELDKLVSTRDKSPSKLSPSMLRGPALKSLQNVEAPKFVDSFPQKANSPGSSHQKQEKSRENGSSGCLTLTEKTGGAIDGTNKTGSSKEQDNRGKGSYMPLISSVEEHPPKKRAFRMCADEDLLELDDDHPAASSPFEMADKQNASKLEKSVGSSIPKGEKPLTSSEARPSSSFMSNGDVCQGTPNGSLETGRSRFASSPVEAVQQSNMVSEPTSVFIQKTEKSTISPAKQISEEKVVSLEEPKKDAAVFPSNFSSPPATDLFNQNTGASANIKLEKTNSTAFGVPDASAKPTETNITFSNSSSGPEPTTSAASTLNGIFSAGPNAVSPPLNNGSLSSSFSLPPSVSNVPSDNSGSEVPQTVQSPAVTTTASSVFGKLPANTSNDSNSASNSQSSPAFSFSSPSTFKLGESAAPFSASTASASSGQISKETEVKSSTPGDTSTGNAFAAKSSENKSPSGYVFGIPSPAAAGAGNMFGSSTLNPSTAATSAPGSSVGSVFGVTSSLTPGTETSKFSGSSTATAGSNIFGTSTSAFTSSTGSMFASVAASTTSSVFGLNSVSSAPAASSQSQASSLFGIQPNNAGSGTTTSTQSVPFQFGSSTSSPFGFTASTSIAAQSSPFGVAKSEPGVFSSGSTPQPSSTNSSAPVFSSSFTTSSFPTFTFGVSSAATGSSVSAPVFGASTNTPSSASMFSFGSTPSTIPQQPAFGNTPSTTPSQSPFGNSNPGFAFGATPQPNSNGMNNQQVSMEDSMAEDTVQANKAPMVQPMFGQATATMPQPGFAFGVGAPTPAFGGGAPTPAFGGGTPTPSPSMANPFQFGGQPSQNTAQNASPFSQSLEHNSFSLGSNGGGDKSSRRIVRVKKTGRKR